MEKNENQKNSVKMYHYCHVFRYKRIYILEDLKNKWVLTSVLVCSSAAVGANLCLRTFSRGSTVHSRPEHDLSIVENCSDIQLGPSSSVVTVQCRRA